MKTNTLFSTLFISALVLSSVACTPRDNPVPDGVRNNLPAYVKGANNNKGKGGPGGANSGQFSLNSFTLAGVLAEKQIEALEIIKVATGTVDAKAALYKTTASEDKGDGQVIMKLDSLSDAVEFEGIEDTWKAKITKNLDVTFAKDSLVGFSAKVSKNCVNGKTKASVPCKFTTSADSVLKEKNYANWIETDYDLTVSAGDSADQLKIQVITKGQIAGAKGGANDTTQMGLNMTLVVNKDSLSTNQVVIVSANAKLDYQNPTKDKMFSMTLQAANITASLDPQCNNLVGKVNFAAGPKNRFTGAFDNAAITIEDKKWSKPIAACGKRPTVDVSRLHVY